jgi:superfamily I DNA/RNA helicase
MNNSWWVDEDQLDEHQKAVIELGPYGRCLIQGPPGSGKTNLLALRAKYLQKLGRHNFAFIAFTRGFKVFLEFGLNQYRIGDDALFTFFSWAHRMCQNHGVPLHYDEGAFDEKRQSVYEVLASIVNADGYKPDYDTILLDEAQDYTAHEIEIIKAASENLMLVADSRQRIFSDSEKDFDLITKMVDEAIVLKYHYRNGHKICKIVDSLDKTGNRVIGSSNYKEEANPSRVEHRQYASADDAITHLIETISNQLVAYHGENIGIICPTRAILDSLQALKSSKIGKHCSFHSDNEVVDFSSGKTVYCLTLHSAKGMEFRVVHMFGWDTLKMPLARNVIYTAVTRAKTSLSVYYLKQLNRPFMQALAELDPSPAAPKLSELFK